MSSDPTNTPPAEPVYKLRTMLTARIGLDLYGDMTAHLLPGETLTEFTRLSLSAELSQRRIFQRNGPFPPSVVRIEGRDANQRLIVSDGGPLMTDGIDGEIVPNTETE